MKTNPTQIDTNTERLNSGRTRPWWNGSGPYVIKDINDARYVGREPDGDTPAIQCWPHNLNRHVMHFTTRDSAQEYIDSGKTGFRKGTVRWSDHRVRRVRLIRIASPEHS